MMGLQWMLGLVLMIQNPYIAKGGKFPSWLMQDTFVNGDEQSQGPALFQSITSCMFLPDNNAQVSAEHLKTLGLIH